MTVLMLILIPIVYYFYYTKGLHILQLEGYKSNNYANWLIQHIKDFINIILASTVMLYTISLLHNLGTPHIAIQIITILAMGIIYYAHITSNNKTKYKKPLVFTWRIKRLIITGYILLFICIFILEFLKFSLGFTYSINVLLILLWIIAFINIFISNFILIPIEKMINLKFINLAKGIINKRDDLIVIGITGSFGKTSTKFILQTILSEKYKTYATPDSYNTTMGNVRAIREQLSNTDQIYISEMGAKHIGDIKEICDIVKPTYGIITSIGNQHLETFKSIENITKTKYELIASLPENGFAFFPDDNGICKELYNKETRNKILFNSENSDIYAKNIISTSKGSNFTIVSKMDNTEFNCNTKLLGIHNVQNIIGCVAIAKKLGLTNNEIAHGIEKIKPVPHRLELIPNTNGITIIDDAFNSNPKGAKAALDVISSFSGNKIIITPGMIELGDEQYSANYELGKQIAEVCNYAILIGKNFTKPLQDGIKDTKFDLKNMYVVNSLDEATSLISQIGKHGDVILFENDLPDNFNE